MPGSGNAWQRTVAAEERTGAPSTGSQRQKLEESPWEAGGAANLGSESPLHQQHPAQGGTRTSSRPPTGKGKNRWVQNKGNLLFPRRKEDGWLWWGEENRFTPSNPRGTFSRRPFRQVDPELPETPGFQGGARPAQPRGRHLGNAWEN